MPLYCAVPTCINKVSDPRRMRRAARNQPDRDEHSIEFEPDTVTFYEFRRQFWDATSTLSSALEKHDFPEAQKRKLLTNVFDKLDDLGPELWNQLCAEAEREFEEADKVADLPVGPVTYQLRRPLKAYIAPSADHE